MEDIQSEQETDQRIHKLQEEHKRLEDTEKKSRDLLGERAESMLWDVDEIMEQKENPENQKLNMETDELYVDSTISSSKQRHTG